MIRYTLTCEKGHQFESWFQSSSAFDDLVAARHISCVMCGSSDVQRALMAPQVQAGKGTTAPDTPSDAEKALTELRKNVEDNSDYVGPSFAQEARKMHDGDAPQRSIYGEAKLDEAKKLIEDGVPVAPLPFMPKRKMN